MTRTSSTVEGKVLAALRVARDCGQKKLAADLGITPSLLSDYERGRKKLTRERLEELVAQLDWAPAAIDRTRAWLVELPPAAPAGGEEDPEEEVRRIVDVVVAAFAEGARPIFLRAARQAQAERQRAEAAELLAVLCPLAEAEQRVLVEKDPAFHRWAVCEALCAASEQAAPADPKRALHLARLACTAAENARDAAGWATLLQAHARAYLGNAWRVCGDLNAADREFATSRRLAEEPVADDPELLEEGRRSDLEAALRRHQEKFEMALALHEEALSKASKGGRSGHLWLAKSATLHQMGDAEGAREALRQALQTISSEREPRLLCIAQFNLAASLLLAGEPEEAAALLPSARAIAESLRNTVDILRFRWMEGRIAAARGHLGDAAETLSEIHREFSRRGSAYDSALSGLHLAEVYLRLGRTAEVKELASACGVVLADQGLVGGGHASWILFRQAVEQETVTIDMVHWLARELELGKFCA